MGILFTGITVKSFFVFIIFVVACLVLNEATRKSKALSIFMFGILPVGLAVLVLTDVIGSPTGNTWFGWIKVVSALIGVWGFLFIRFTKLGEKKFAIYFPVTILSLNIA